MAKVWKKLQRADSDFAGTVTGNVSGTVDGVAVATVKNGAAAGATANQDDTATIRAGTTAANVGLGNVPNYTAATMRAGVTKSDVGLANVANETRATILGGTFTGDVGGTSASDIRSKALAAKDAVDGNAAVTMVGGSINIGSGEWTVDNSGNQVVNGTITINKDSGGDAGLTLDSGSSGDMKILMEGANPQIDMGGSAPLGTTSHFLRRGSTGNQCRTFYTTGATVIGCIGFANQPSAHNDQFAIHTAAIYDNSSPYVERALSFDADGKMGMYANTKTYAGFTFGTDGTNSGVYIKDGGLSIGTTDKTYKLDVNGVSRFQSTTRHSAGSAAWPSITYHSDVDTGIWFPGSGTFAISTNGVEAFRLDTSQNSTFAGTIASGGINSTGSVRGSSGSEAAPGLQLGGADDGFYHDGGIRVITNNVWEALFKDGGAFHTDGDIVAYSTTTTSDRRLKTDVVELEGNLKKIMELEPVKFDWLVKDKGEDIGLIAQDVQKVIPEVVKEVEPIGETAEFLDDDSMLTVDYAKLVPVLIGAIQELREKVEYLEARV